MRVQETQIVPFISALRCGSQISLFVMVLTCFSPFARADIITFNDLTDTLTVTAVPNNPPRITGLNNCTTSPTSEMCLGIIDTSPYAAGGIIVSPMNDLPDFVLIYEGANTSTGLSDYITRVDLGNSVSVNFFSDGTAENPLPLPAILNGADLTGCFAGVIVVRTTGGLQSVLCTQETGMVQTAGNITFQQAGTGAHFDRWHGVSFTRGKLGHSWKPIVAPGAWA